MRYILSSDYRFKGWHEAPTGLYNSRTRMTAFLPKDKYLLLLKCDGVQNVRLPDLEITCVEKLNPAHLPQSAVDTSFIKTGLKSKSLCSLGLKEAKMYQQCSNRTSADRLEVSRAVLAERADEVLRKLLSLIDISADFADPALLALCLGLRLDV